MLAHTVVYYCWLIGEYPVVDSYTKFSPFGLDFCSFSLVQSQLTTVNLHGALLLQQMLKFTHCGPVIAGFLSMDEDELAAVACSSPGSYLLEAFMACTRVNDKRKERFAAKLKVTWG